MAPTQDVSSEFQRRRGDTWRRIRWWMLLVVLAGGAFALGPHEPDGDLTFGQLMFQMGMFIILLTGMVVVIRSVNKHYRCPACNSVPMLGFFAAGGSGFGYEEGVALNPRTCSKCGAKLR